MLGTDFISKLSELSKAEIAYQVIRPYVGGEIPDNDLRRICEETVAFDFPIAADQMTAYTHWSCFMGLRWHSRI
jgi:threonine synthase